MPSDQDLRCRICGLKQESPPWGEDGRTPLFEHCPCCGVEWGYQDATPVGARRYRERWLKNGASWDNPAQRSPDWNLEDQMKHVAELFR
jgi:hypothetical protein